MARAPGFAPALVNVTLREYETLGDVELRLEPSKALKGRVIDRTGNPISGAFVYLREIQDYPFEREDNCVARSGPDGMFVIESFPPEFRRVVAYHPDYAPGASFVSENTVIVLESPSKLEGVVTFNRNPVADATVWVSCLSKTPLRPFAERKTKDDGTFSFSNLMPGNAKVGAGIGREGGWGLEQSILLEPGRTTRVELALEQSTAVLEGRITVHGEPPAEGSVGLHTLASNGSEKFFRRMAHDGTYRLEGLPAGDALLSISAKAVETDKWYRKLLEVPLAEGEVCRQDFDFSGEGQVSGQLLGFGSGLEGLVSVFHGMISVFQASDLEDVLHLQVKTAACKPNGTYQLEALEPGTYTLVARVRPADDQFDFSEISFASSVVTIQDNETVNVDFDFR